MIKRMMISADARHDGSYSRDHHTATIATIKLHLSYAGTQPLAIGY
jgi:hypothetical protein